VGGHSTGRCVGGVEDEGDDKVRHHDDGEDPPAYNTKLVARLGSLAARLVAHQLPV
jgi:hypothetical protein